MSSKPDVIDLENAAERKQPKITYAGDSYEGQPYLSVTEDGIVIVGNKTNVISVTDEFGVLLSGKLSFGAMPDQISIGGGYWRFNPLLTSCVPSTTPTPIPTLVQATPELLRSASSIADCEATLLAYSDIA